MSATLSPTALPRARNLPVRSAVRPLAKAAIAVLAAVAAMAALLALRFGLYAATHGEMPVLLHVFQSR